MIRIKRVNKKWFLENDDYVNGKDTVVSEELDKLKPASIKETAQKTKQILKQKREDEFKEIFKDKDDSEVKSLKDNYSKNYTTINQNMVLKGTGSLFGLAAGAVMMTGLRLALPDVLQTTGVIVFCLGVCSTMLTCSGFKQCLGAKKDVVSAFNAAGAKINSVNQIDFSSNEVVGPIDRSK